MSDPIFAVPAFLPVHAYFHSDSETKPVERRALVIVWECLPYKTARSTKAKPDMRRAWRAIVADTNPGPPTALNYVGVFAELKAGKAACLAAIKTKQPKKEPE